MNYEKIIEHFKIEYKKLANEERAVQEKRYLKSPFKFFGVSVWDSRKIAKAYFKTLEITKQEMWELAFKLWNSEYHELRRTAIHLLKYHSKKLDKTDINNIENLLRTSTNWDQVDEICAHLMGAIIEKDWDAVKPYLKKWSTDKNFWMRRSSLLSQLLLLRGKDSDNEVYEKGRDLFFELSETMLDESKFSDEEYTTDIMPKNMGKFFIRKAIGWVLRDMSKVHPKDVVNYVNKNKNKLSGLSYREATRKLKQEHKKLLV